MAAVALDLRAVIRAAPDRYVLLDAQLVILEASDAYLAATLTSREDILGRGVFDAFPGDETDETAEAVRNRRTAFAQVIAERRPHALPAQRYPIRRSGANGDELEDRYWSGLSTPVLDDDGNVTCILHRVEDVTEMVRLEREKLELDRALRDAATRSQHFHQLLDQAPDAMVVVGEDGRIQLINVQAEMMFGYTREELVGKPLEVLIPERYRADHGRHMTRFFASPETRPMGTALQLFGRRKDSSEVPIEVSLSPQRDETGTTVSAAIRDISERVRLEAEIRLSADRLRTAVESIQDAFALFDADDRLVMCNSAFRRLVHESLAGSLIGKPYAALLDAWIDDVDFPDAEARERWRAERLAVRRQPTSSTDIRMRDGRSLRVIDRRTADGGIVKTIWDLTEDEARAAELRDARAAAEAASAAKSDFLSSMSHELRTPLNSILGFAQLLLRDKREPLSARHRDRLEHIESGGEHLLRLINDILDLSKIEAGRITVSPEPVSVASVLDELRPTLAPIAAREEISVEIVDTSAGAAVFADRTRFVQILMNFGSNAIKYNRRAGSVRFVVAPPAAGKLRITVADTGNGIPLDKQDKLFQPFQRAGQEAGTIEGTGIGLVITKRLAELMQGRVGFRSVPGEGSEFWVELPLHQEAGFTTPEPAAPVRKEGRRSTGERQLVLYVEDNPANVMFMRDLMSTLEDIELLTVPTAELGIQLARTRQPQLVIMDINLPGMSGLAALRAMQESDETRHIPVIALTAAASARDRARGLEAGFYRYLAKPVNIDELIEAAESALRRD